MIWVIDRCPQVAPKIALQPATRLRRNCTKIGFFQRAHRGQIASLAADFSEMEFVVAGPGARDGIRKCFNDTAGLSDPEIIQVMAERAGDEFGRLGMRFQTLWGRRLQLIDCQNVFCEVSKYARVAHPDVEGESGRTRIKQRFTARSTPIPQWYPPKWGISPTPEDSGVTCGVPLEAVQ